MAKTDQDTTAAPPDSFPITLDEFVSGLPKGNIESAKAFAGILKGTPPKPQAEWSAYYLHFGNKPDGMPWLVWLGQLETGTEVTADGK